MPQWEHSAILSIFINLTVIKILILSLSEWPFNTVLTVHSHREASDEAAYASPRLKLRRSPMSKHLIIRWSSTLVSRGGSYETLHLYYLALDFKWSSMPNL